MRNLIYILAIALWSIQGFAIEKQIDIILNSTGGSQLAVPSVGSAFATDTNTLTFTGKTMDGGSNTFTNIPSSAVPGAGNVNGQSSSVDSEIALFSGTGGKTIKRATQTGIITATAGVIGTASTNGSGSVVLTTSPTLVTPVLGVAAATTINKLTLTTPATGSTFTLLDGKTFQVSNSLTFTGTDSSTLNIGTGGTLGTAAYTAASAYASADSNNALGTCTTAKTVDWSTSKSFTLTLTNGSNCALTFSNASAGNTITIDLTQASSGGGTATASWATTTKWSGGTIPTISTGNSASDTCTIKFNGTDYRGSCIQNFL